MRADAERFQPASLAAWRARKRIVEIAARAEVGQRANQPWPTV